MSRNTLLSLIGGREYAVQTPDLCCCSSCRDLGFVGYELLRQIVRDVLPLCTTLDAARRKALSTELTRRIDDEERYRAGEFLGHLKKEDTTPQHCLGLMCAPFNDANFRCGCEHARHDGGRVEAPPTMAAQHPTRSVTSDDWFDTCHICYSAEADDEDENRESFMCCHSCKLVAHKSCMVKNGNDVPDCKDTPWVCPSCVRKHDSIHHDTRCLKCESHEYLIDDLRAVCKLALDDATNAGESTDAATWGAACLESANVDILAYHAHLARDVNQDMFQKSMFLKVEEYHQYVTDLCGYWAKQGARKMKTGTCEGLANKGVSCHGRMFTFR